MKSPSCPEKGFTLIELMVTIAIIAIVFGVIITSSGAIQKSSRDSQRKANLASIQAALEQYHADNSVYPLYPLSSSLNSGGKTYLREIPKDPSTNSDYVYKPYNSIEADCDLGVEKCIKYCLFADLENNPAPLQADIDWCSASGTDGNYFVTNP